MKINQIIQMDTNTYKCEICGKESKTASGLSSHLRYTHNISSKDYYDKYIKKENEGICKYCGTPAEFNSISKGYKKHCKKCAKINGVNARKQTCREKYGVDYYQQTSECKEKAKRTNREKYGVDYYQQTSECKEKVKETNREKYGVDSYTQTKECKEKKKQTCIEKYGVDSYSQTNECKEKVKQTNREKYGVDSYAQSEECKEKTKQTCIKKYSVDSYSKTSECKEKVKQTNREKYGVDYYQQTNECKNRVKQTNQKKYNADSYTQSEQFLLNLPNIQQKTYETRKKNHTFNSSHIEEQFAEYLTTNNYKFERQYKSDKYPFSCDFYLNDYDLYIEINGSWTHGNEPYNQNKKEHQEILNEWKRKGTKYYNNAIYVWTVLDVKKQQIAKQNNLNYLTIYSNDIQEVIKQFEKYILNN